MDYAVDMQGFKKPGNDFVLKELSLVSLNDDDEPYVLLFKPPFSWRRLTDKYKRENLWLQLYYHGLSWNSGDWDYIEIGKILQDAFKDANRIFVIGKIRKLWLERFNYNVIDINEMDYQSFNYPRSVTICTNHNGACKTICAMYNLKRIKQFYRKDSNMEWEDVMDWQDINDE